MAKISRFNLPWVMFFAIAISAPLLHAAPAGKCHEIETNVAHAESAPTWLTSNRVDRVADQIQAKLEWDIRKIHMVWYTDPAEFKRMHGFDDTVLAVTRKGDNSVHLGPRVDTLNFDQVFGHELVHVILYQKYKEAVPKWLEEGMANYLSKHGRVDYAWLASQSDRDVLALRHPFAVGVNGIASGGARYHYQASQALMEMIASHCPVTDLLQLSVGKKLESYLPTLCGIDDLNGEFKKWVKRKASKLGPVGGTISVQPVEITSL